MLQSLLHLSRFSLNSFRHWHRKCWFRPGRGLRKFGGRNLPSPILCSSVIVVLLVVVLNFPSSRIVRRIFLDVPIFVSVLTIVVALLIPDHTRSNIIRVINQVAQIW
jgi:hypothetical protein